MARAEYIQPSLEEWIGRFYFYVPITVRFSDTDMSGHVNNTRHLVYFEQGRVEYFDQFRFYGQSLSLVVADITCHYHSEAFFREGLKLGVRAARLGNSSLELEYCLLAEKDNRLVASGRGTMVVMDKETKRSAPIPPELRARITELEKME